MAGWTVDEFFAPEEGSNAPSAKGMSPEEFFAPEPPPAAAPAPAPIKAAPGPSTEDASRPVAPFMGELPSPGDITPTPPAPPAPPSAAVPPPPAPPAAVAPPIAGDVPLPRARPVEFGPPIPPREEEGPPASAAPPLPPMSFNEVMRRKMAGEPTPPEWDQPLTPNGEPIAAQALRGIAKTGEFGKGLSGAVYGGNAQMLGNATEALGILAGSEKIEKLGGDLAKHGKEQGDKYKPRVPGFENVRRDSFGNFISDAFAFAGYSAGQAVGTSAPSIAAGSAAAVLTANPIVGLAMGAIGPSYVQNWGDVYGSAKENKGIASRIEKGELSKKDLAGLTAIAAVPIAALDVVGLETMLGHGAFVVAKQGLKNRVMAWMANRAIGAGTEGATEGVQEVLSQWAQHDVGGDQTLKQAAFSVINNALGGVFGGGLTSAATSVGEQNRNSPGAKIGDALDRAVEGAKFKAPAATEAMQGFSPNPATAGAPGDFPNQLLTDRPSGPPPEVKAAAEKMVGDTFPDMSPQEIRAAVDAAAVPSAAAPATSESDVAAAPEKPAEQTAQEPDHPPASPRETAILKSYGYDDADIAEMPPEQRAEEVKAAIESGVAEPQGTSRAAPIDLNSQEALKQADELVDEDHTHAQAEGRNRPLVHATWGGMPLSIEARAGGTRKMQVPETGEPVTQRVGATYGYWKGTKGGDGQEVDVAIGPHLSGNSTVYVIDENGKNGKFRQVKTFIGFASPDDAVSAYLGNGKSVDSIGSMVAVSSENFRKWIKKGGRGRGERLPKAWGNKVLNLQDLDQYKVAMSQSENPVVPQLRGEGDSAGSRVGVGLSGVQGAFGDAGPSTEGMGTGSNRQREGLLPRQPSLGEQGGPSGQYEKSGTSEAGRQDNVRAGVGSGNRSAPVDDNAPSEKRGESERGPVFEQKGRSSHGVTKPASEFAGAPVGEQVAPQLAGDGIAPPSPANTPKTADEAQRALWDAKYEAQKIKRDLDRIENSIENPRTGKNSLDQLRLDELRKRQEGIARSLRKKYAEALDAVDDAREAVKRAPARAPAEKPKKPDLANRPSEPTRGGVAPAPSPEELDIPTFLKRNKANVEALDEPTIAAAQDIAAADPAEAIEKAYVNELKSSGLVTEDEIKEHLGDAAIEPARTHEPSAPSEEPRGEPAEAGGEQGNQVGEHGGTAGENQPSGEESVGGGDRAEGKPEAGENATEGKRGPVAGKKQAKAELRARVIAWVNEGKTVGDIQRALRSDGAANSDVVRASRMAVHYEEQASKQKGKKAGPNEKPAPAKPEAERAAANPPSTPVPPAKNTEALYDRVAESYLKSTGGKWNTRGLISDVRKDFPDLSRGEFDNLLKNMQRQDKVTLYRMDNQVELTDADREAAIRIGNEPREILWIDHDFRKPSAVADLTEAEYAAANPPAEENKTGVEKQIVDMYLASTGDRLNQRVPISGIRYRLPQVSRSDMDAALERMHLTEGMTLSGDDNPSKLATSIRNGGLKFKGVDLYYLWITKLPDGMQAETKPSAQQGEARDEAKPEAKQSAFEKSAESIKDPLVRALYPIVREGNRITQKQLQLEAEKAYGSSLSEGKFTRKDIYDALEVAVNRAIAHDVTLHIGNIPHWKSTYDALDKLLGNLPTQTVRSEEQQQFQQFSTPPTYSMAAAFAANIRDGDVVLEPSAGTGSLIAAASHPGATIYANELSPRRAALLRSFDDVKRVFTENAEQLNNVLPDDVKPTVVVMNPPFSQTAGRMRDKKDLMAGANHVRQAYKRLQPGGRLVAIVGRGMTPGSARYAPFWNEIPRDGTLVANIGVDGKVYSKYGTSFGTRLLVIDKAKYGEDFKATTGDVDTVDALMSMLEPIRDARPAIEPKPAEQAGETLAPTDQPLGGPGQSVPSNAGAVGPGRGSKRGLAEPGPGGAGIAGGAASGMEPGQRDVVAPVESQRTGQAGAGQESDIRSATGEKSEGGGAQGAERDIQPATSGQPSAPTSGVSPVEKLVVEQAKPGSQTASEITDSLYESYQPRKLKIEGAKGHPGPLVESAAMASVGPPSVNYSPSLPKTVVKNGLLSLPQLEAVVYAGQAHGDLLPAAEDAEPVRKGFFIGDGTGVGKGREISGIILDNWQQGRTKAIWVSEKKKLLNDARRDWGGLEQDPKAIFDMGSVKSGESITAAKGIAFVTYDTLKGGLSDQAAIARGGFVRGQEVKIISGVSLKDDLADRAGLNAIVTGKGVKSGSAIVYPVKFSDGATAKVSGSILEPVGEAKTVKSRVDQIVEWVGKDFDGVIAFDEAHNMGNALAMKGDRGVQDASQKALSGVALQAALPKARVVYVSATGATEVYNLAYADRLGLWGRGTAFADKTKFINEVQGGGIAAMEIVARDMKQLGVYMARNLSYDDGTPNGRVEYDRLEHKLSSDQREIYDTCAEAWHVVLQNIEAALEATGGKENKRARTAALSAFWGTHQRFFNQVITSLQMPSVIKAVEADLAAGRQAVLQLTNTNEASQERAVAKVQSEEELEDLDITPRDQLIQLVEKSFPTQQFETYVDEDGNERVRAVLDSAGKPVQNAEAVEMRDALIERISTIRVPQGPLDMILDHFGADVVAEVTGRKRRFIFKEDDKGNRRRMEDSRPGSANENETNAFQAGKKKVLVFSEAGGTGASYHADNTAASKNARRSHYLVQAGWRADKAVQGFGRTHRTNQASAPIFHLVTTDLDGQKRFISSIARRLAQLGALTKGQRQAGDQGIFSARDNLESDEARLALRQFLGDLAANRVEGLDVDTFEKQTGLSLRQKTEDGGIVGVKVDNIDITQFLNRLLSLKIDTQNRTFAEFSKRLDGIIEYRAAAGLLDSGLETVRASKIEKKSEATVYTDEKTGAETKHVELQLSDKLIPLDFRSAAKGKDFVKWVKSPKGRVYAVQNASSVMSADTGSITPQYRLVGPIGSRLTPQASVEGWRSEWEQISPAEAEEMWGKEVAAAPEFTTRRMHLITGAILPIWDRLKGSTRVVRLNTTEGERMIGRVIPNSAIGDTLKALGASAAQNSATPQEVYNRIMAGGSVVLANRWRLSRRLVAGQHRIELTGPASWSEGQQVKSDGVFTERIGYTTRYFVPADEERGPKVIAKLTEFRPVSEISGGESEVASLGGYDINQAERNIELKRLYSQERILMSRYVESPSEDIVREFEALSERIAALEGRSREAVHSQQAIKAAGKWTEAHKAQIAADVAGIVRRVVGDNVRLNTPETHRVSNLKGWGHSSGSVEVAGAMRLSEALLTVSISPRFVNANQTAYHEAYHAIEGLLQTDQERALMERETPQLRQYLRTFAKTGALSGITANEVEHLAGYEVRAIMFELYGSSTDKFSGGSAIRRFFLKVHHIAQRFMRVLRMRGFRGWEDVFQAAYYGEFAGREARPLSERTLGSDTPESAARRRKMTPARARASAGLQVSHERISEAMNDPTLTSAQRLKQAMGAATLPVSRAMWDRVIDLYRFQRAAEVANGWARTPTGLDAHLAATLYTGRTGARFKEFKRLKIDPILDAMNERGITLDDMNAFLYARHAEERNIAIETIDPTNTEGSGMSTADANAILARFGAQRSDFDTVAAMVDDVLRESRRLLVNSGLESQSTIQDWEAKYAHYVPLKGSEMADDEWGSPGVGEGYSIRGTESMRALGRHSMAGDIMANVFDQSMRAIVRAEKNRVALAFYRFAKANPSPWYKMGLAERRRHINPNTGLVEWQTVTTDRNAESAFAVKIGGNVKYMQIMHPGLLIALKDVGGERMNAFFRGAARFTRFYSSLQTAKNPEFVLTNLLRDLADAGLNLTAEQQSGFKRAFAKNILSGKAFAAAFLGESRDASGTGKIAQAIESKAPGFIRYYDEWQAHGGKISMYGLKDIQSLADELRRDMRRSNESAGKRALMALPRAPGSLIKLFEGISDVTESMTRLAVYGAAREAGLSPPVAAKAAREMTVDFNAKGQYGRYINALYAFAGPSIIGPTRLVRRLARSKTMRRAAMGVAGIGFLVALWNLWAAPKDDEDKKNRYARMKYWERERNFVVFIPGWKDGLKIPMGYGVAPFWMIGEEAAMALMGETPWTEASGNVIGTLASSFNPLGAEGSAFSLRFWASMATPTILDPVMQLLRNRNWLDRPIHPDRDRFPQGAGLANSEIAKATTSPYAVDVAKWLNRNSGGGMFSAIDSKYQGTPFAARPGALDFYPDDLEFVWNFALGGLGKFVLQNFDMFKDMREGVDTPVERTPFIRRFAVPGESEGLRASEYYDSAHKVSEAAASYRASLKSQDPSAKGLRDELKKGLKPYTGERGGQKFMAEDVFAGSNETLKRLRKNEEAVKKDKKLTPEGRASAIKDIRNRRLETMRRTNRLYESRYGD